MRLVRGWRCRLCCFSYRRANRWITVTHYFYNSQPGFRAIAIRGSQDFVHWMQPLVNFSWLSATPASLPTSRPWTYMNKTSCMRDCAEVGRRGGEGVRCMYLRLWCCSFLQLLQTFLLITVRARAATGRWIWITSGWMPHLGFDVLLYTVLIFCALIPGWRFASFLAGLGCARFVAPGTCRQKWGGEEEGGKAVGGIRGLWRE